MNNSNTPEPLILSRPLVQKLFAHAQMEPDAEVCGLIGAQDGNAMSHYPVKNLSPQPNRLFQMDEQAQIAAMKGMRERGEELFAIYHSHPTSPPEPSSRDSEGMSYPDAWYLIISLNIKGVLEMRAWRLEDGSLNEHKVKILPD